MIESPQPFKEPRKMHGPQVPYSQELHAQKYRGSGESFRGAMNRIAAALKDDDQHFADFRDTLLGMRFLPAGRIQSAMGSTRQVTPYNCYVSGTIQDSFVSGEGSIMERATEAAATMRMGGGIGYDFSTLRPRGDLIRKLQSHSSGPISFMHIFDSICKCIASSGHRRGAQMGVMRVDHPDIEEFIHAKQPGKDVQPLWDLVSELPDGSEKSQLIQSLQSTLKLTGFNVSVAVTDKFMECVASGEPFPLTFEGRTYREVDARALWDAIMRGTWDWAEPGVLFIDAINRMNNLWYCEKIAATNPCFTGDTKVWTAYGEKTFKELAASGASVPVLTEDQDGRLVYKMMRNPRVTQRQAKLVEVTVRAHNGELSTVRCTPQHVFFLKDGGKREASQLTAGDRIESVYRYKANSRGYLTLSNGRETVMEHHVACEFKHGRRPQYPEEHAHHVNGILWDNAPENIELVNGSDHNSAHMRGERNPMVRYPERNPFRTTKFSGKANGRWRDDVSTARIAELRAQGLSFDAIAREVGCSKYTAQKRLTDNHVVVSVKELSEVEDVYCGTVDSTARFFVSLGDHGVLVSNCGEQPLPPYGACLLGSFNLVKYIYKDGAGRYAFDWDQYREDIPQVVRAMDNVVDRAIYPLPQQKQEAKDKRRMGLGITGLANAAEALGHEYGSPAFLAFEAEVLDTLRDESYLASAHIAKVKGSFPKFDKDKYLQGQFIKTLREDVRDAIAKYGIRNSHLTSIAPTGTISLCADNVSSGIEPVFAYSFDRTVIEFSGPRVETVEDYGARVFGVRGKACSRVTVQEHVAALTVAAQRVDSAVSKTCNVPSDISWEDFKNVYVSAWEGGAKGCTTFRLGGKRSGILVVKDDGGEPEADAPAEEPASQCRIDPATGRRECE